MFTEYHIWFQRMAQPHWVCTEHSVQARTDKEAQSKVRRKFQNCGFSSMSFVGVPSDIDPNTVLK